MHVTNSTIYRSFLANVDALDEQLDRVNQQISSGKKLVYLRDSPSTAAESLLLRWEGAELDLYKANTDSSGFYLQVTDSALDSVQNLITSIQTKGIQAASETVNTSDLASIAIEIRSLRDQVLSLANTEVRGRYIFGGSMVSAPAFSIAGDSVSYLGDDEVNRIVVSDGISVQQNMVGSAVFSPIFASVQALLTAMDAGDRAAIGNAVGQITSSLSGLSLARSQVGGDLGKIENLRSQLGTDEVNLKAQQSRVEDVNVADAAIRLNEVQTALKATLVAGQSIMQQENLFDFLV
jgi:flagellar hook-associated protein 3 FlgL